MAAERITFPGAHGATLVGRLHRPAGAPRAWALFAHCFTCSKDLQAARRLTGALAAQGIGVLRFDFTGLGESEGHFADTNFSGNVDDLVAAARHLAEVEAAPQLLVGHSLGGAAVVAAALELDSVRAVATLGAPADPGHVAQLLDPVKQELAEEGEAIVELAGRPFRVKQQFLDDLEEQTQHERIAGLGRALLVLHSPQDRTVPVEHARRLFVAARHPKSFVSLDGADHLLSQGTDATYAGQVIAAWAGRYLPETPS